MYPSTDYITISNLISCRSDHKQKGIPTKDKRDVEQIEGLDSDGSLNSDKKHLSSFPKGNKITDAKVNYQNFISVKILGKPNFNCNYQQEYIMKILLKMKKTSKLHLLLIILKVMIHQKIQENMIIS